MLFATCVVSITVHRLFFQFISGKMSAVCGFNNSNDSCHAVGYPAAVESYRFLCLFVQIGGDGESDGIRIQQLLGTWRLR